MFKTMNTRPRRSTSVPLFTISSTKEILPWELRYSSALCLSTLASAASMVTNSLPRKWNFPRVVAHRGGGTLFPENTLLAIDGSLKHYGLRAIEFDVVLTRDEVPILMHDDVLGRTTIDLERKGKLVDEFTYSELSKMDVGSWFQDPIVGKFAHAGLSDLESERVPSFESVLQYCTANAVWMNIEIKPIKGKEVRTGEVVAKAVSRYFPTPQDIKKNAFVEKNDFKRASISVGGTDSTEVTRKRSSTVGASNIRKTVARGGAGSGSDSSTSTTTSSDTAAAGASSSSSGGASSEVKPMMPLFSSFSFEALKAAHEAAPHIPYSFLIESFEKTPDWEQKLAEIHSCNLISLNCDHTHLTEEQVKKVKAAGYHVYCYTVNEVERAEELLRWGVDAVCTDRIDLFAKSNIPCF